MRWAIIALVLLGVLAAASAALLVASYGRGQSREAQKVELLVATKALPAMTVIDAGMVLTKTATRKEAPANFYTNAVQVVGKVLLTAVAEGQALTPDCFGDRESGAKFASAISAGMVAVSISPKDYASLEGLLYPGCLVDVIFTSKSGGEQQPVSVTLLESVSVLAIGQYSVVSPKQAADSLAPTHRGDTQKVTLQLTPRQAKKLNLAMDNGSVSLVLRNPLSPTGADGGSISLNELLGKGKSTAAAAAPGKSDSQVESAPEGWIIDMVQGGVSEKRTVPMPEGDSED